MTKSQRIPHNLNPYNKSLLQKHLPNMASFSCPTEQLSLSKLQLKNQLSPIILAFRMMNSNEMQLLNQRNKLHKHRVDKNRLLCASILNVITFICAIFSMAYPEWIQISFSVNVREPNQEVAVVTIWSSLLYGTFEGERLLYADLQESICSRDDTFCLAILYELDFTGKLCFSIFLLAFLISGYDCARIVKFTLAEVTTKSKFFVENASANHFKNNFRSVFMLITYAVGLSLDYFAITFIQLETFSYGASFWIFVSSLILFVIVSLWENRKMTKISRQQLVIRLLEREKEVLRGSNHSEGKVSNSSSDLFTI